MKCLTRVASRIGSRPSPFFVINDLHNAIKLSSPFHFADDTCVLNKQNSIDKISKTLNKNLKELSFWLNASKIALNATKTKVILFKNKRKTNISKLNFKLCRKKLHPVESARYLGVTIDENLNWKKHVNRHLTQTDMT